MLDADAVSDVLNVTDAKVLKRELFSLGPHPPPAPDGPFPYPALRGEAPGRAFHNPNPSVRSERPSLQDFYPNSAALQKLMFVKRGEAQAFPNGYPYRRGRTAE